MCGRAAVVGSDVIVTVAPLARAEHPLVTAG
jgi:hypothetical protein